jgi:flagellar motor switch protein FliN/FliY
MKGNGNVMDAKVRVEARLGGKWLSISEVASIGAGTIIEFDGEIVDPVELTVEGEMFALAEVISIRGKFGVRILELLEKETLS